KTWKVAYHGPAEDSLAEGKSPKAALSGALDALLGGKSPTVTHVGVKGTKIAFPDHARKAEFAKISYAKDVAPALAKNCVSCHVAGGIAPFAMDRYESVKTYAPMIRESLRTRRMPP